MKGILFFAVLVAVSALNVGCGKEKLPVDASSINLQAENIQRVIDDKAQLERKPLPITNSSGSTMTEADVVRMLEGLPTTSNSALPWETSRDTFNVSDARFFVAVNPEIPSGGSGAMDPGTLDQLAEQFAVEPSFLVNVSEALTTSVLGSSKAPFECHADRVYCTIGNYVSGYRYRYDLAQGQVTGIRLLPLHREAGSEFSVDAILQEVTEVGVPYNAGNEMAAFAEYLAEVKVLPFTPEELANTSNLTNEVLNEMKVSLQATGFSADVRKTIAQNEHGFLDVVGTRANSGKHIVILEWRNVTLVEQDLTVK